MYKIKKIWSSQDGIDFCLYFENKEKFWCSRELTVKLGFVVGRELDEEVYLKLIAQSFEILLFRSIKGKLVNQIRTKKQIERWIFAKFLKSKDKARLENITSAKQITKEVIAKLEMNNLLNDEIYAKFYIEDNLEKKSEFEIKKSLLQKGVDKNIIEQLYMRYNPDCGILIQKLIEKKKRQLSHKDLDKYELKKKISAFLAGKGFKYNDFSNYLNE